MRRIINDGFIRVYNKMIDDKSEYRVTPHELYTYSLLFNNKRQDESMFTSIAMIEATMSPKAMYSDRKQTNQKKIRETLKGLTKKRVLLLISQDDVINVEDDDEFFNKFFDKLKANDFFTLKINDIELKHDPKVEEFDGFEKLYIGEFVFFMNPYEQFIYIVSKRFSKDKKGFEGSYTRWGKLLDVSRNTAVKFLEEAKERNLIKVVSGIHINPTRQEINSYYNNNLLKDEVEVEQGSEEIKQKKPKLKVVKKGLSPEEAAREVF